MIIDEKAVDSVTEALIRALATAKAWDGRKIVPPQPTEYELHFAVIAALMVLTRSHVIPSDTRLIVGFGTPDEAAWPPRRTIPTN